MFFFSGLFRHGGYPPVETSEDEPDPDDIRWGLILYPSKPMLDGTSSITYAASPKGKLYYMPKEMVHPDFDDFVPQRKLAVWLTSGPALTDRDGFLQWFYRSQCLQLAS